MGGHLDGEVPMYVSRYSTSSLIPYIYLVHTPRVELNQFRRIRLSYNDVHKTIQNAAVKIKDQFGQSAPLWYKFITAIGNASPLYLASISLATATLDPSPRWS